MEIVIGLLIGMIFTAIVASVIAITKAGSLGQAFWGMSVARQVGANADLQGKVLALVGGVAPPPSQPTTPTAPPKPSGEPLRLLTLLQAESRLIDFLMENIDGAKDDQIGFGVRELHRKAAAVLKSHLVIEPVLPGSEGDTVTVPVGFDPSAVRVTGNVTGQPPFSGQLQHAGWRVKELKLPNVAAGQDLFVVQPAEVQV